MIKVRVKVSVRDSIKVRVKVSVRVSVRVRHAFSQTALGKMAKGKG